MEKNLLSIFKLCKDIFLGRLAYILGFRSLKVKEFIFTCGDHHISWQILQVYEAFASKFLFLYVTDCNQKGSLTTAKGFVQWRNNHVVNPMHNFSYDLLFNLLLGMMCHRAGIRRNNSTFALCGRQKVTPIMFTGKHNIYQPLIMNDMRIRVEALTKVKSYIKHNESFNRYGDHFRGEGGDYVTNIENKHLKSHFLD